ncbi:MAG TPA: pilus assembly protein TadG-related protein [Tepidisphaeraceae bacterium]|nr:pilus assembly protein TadG-related protein [Tepidisphaeraceae bacterium]
MYAIIALSALVGLSSLGVDYGRVQVAKYELQRAADAAARAAAASLSSGVAAVQTTAVTYAGYNSADGTAISVAAGTDVEFGTWNSVTRTFTVLTGVDRASANAVRVTAHRTAARGNPVTLSIGAMVGRPTCDVKATAVAVAPQAFGLIGLSSVSFAATGTTDSYDSSVGSYSSLSARSNGSLASNGDISITGNGTIKGDAHAGIGHTTTVGGSATVTGYTNPLTRTLTFPPPTLPGSYTFAGTVNVNSGVYNIPAGDYYCTGLTVSSNATFNCLGPVRVFCSGPVNITGGYIGTYQNRPKNFQLLMTNSSSVTMGGQASFYGQIYAPQSTVTQTGTAEIYGSVIANVLSFHSSWQGGMHFDESLSGSSGGAILLVR